MDFIFYVVAGLVGIALLIVVAFPDFFIPREITTTKTVGASYWGFYEGKALKDGEKEKKLKFKLTRKKELVVAGANTYALGRGVKMRGM